MDYPSFLQDIIPIFESHQEVGVPPHTYIFALHGKYNFSNYNISLRPDNAMLVKAWWKLVSDIRIFLLIKRSLHNYTDYKTEWEIYIYTDLHIHIFLHSFVNYMETSWLSE